MAKDLGGIVVRFVDKWPGEEIMDLYRAGGWWSEGDEVSSIEDIVSKSFVFAVAVEESSGRAVGMGRVISDGVSDAYIQDVVVLPGFRGQDVGRKLIEALRDYCLSKGIDWIGLVAESGTADFYSGLGFRALKGHTAMKYEEGAK